MIDSTFIQNLRRELVRNRFHNYTDNYDVIQLGPEPPAATTPSLWEECILEFKQRFAEIGQFVTHVLKQIGAYLKYFLQPVKRITYFYFIPDRYFRSERNKYPLDQYYEISFLYDLLGNQTSRDLLVKLFAYRMLGHRKIKLPRNHPQFWRDIRDIQKYKTSATPIKIKFMDASLAQYDFTPMGFNLKAYATGPGGACAFVQRQYEYHLGDIHCKAMPGDIAIDAGGCWGETTLYFAHEVGPQGQVVSFEFIPSNLGVMRANLEENPELSQRIILVENPIWSHSGLKLYYVDWGPGSRITEDEKRYQYDGTCETITIDDVVAQKGLLRVDFIKMDIEGAEFPALRGAEQTIRNYRPKLAISLYHQLSDFITIPRWLSELNLGYDFYLDHHTIYQNETVLFALPRKNVSVNPLPQISKAA
jgi:FkbM family methyltransferase